MHRSSLFTGVRYPALMLFFVVSLYLPIVEQIDHRGEHRCCRRVTKHSLQLGREIDDYDDSVPTIVADLVAAAPSGCSLDALIFGGAPVDRRMPEKAKRVFPNAMMFVECPDPILHLAYQKTLHRGQAYGMTETSSVAVTHSGEDYTQRPTSTSGFPLCCCSPPSYILA